MAQDPIIEVIGTFLKNNYFLCKNIFLHFDDFVNCIVWWCIALCSRFDKLIHQSFAVFIKGWCYDVLPCAICVVLAHHVENSHTYAWITEWFSKATKYWWHASIFAVTGYRLVSFVMRAVLVTVIVRRQSVMKIKW